MGIKNFIPAVWSAKILESLQKAHVFAAVCNRNYQGSISGAGDEVEILELGTPTVSAYTEGSTTVTYEQPDTVKQVLKVDQSYFWAIEIPDIDKAQSLVNPIQIYASKAARELAEKVDEYIAGLYASAGCSVGVVGTPIAVNSENVVEQFTLMAKKLDVNNVAQTGRFAIIPPWLAEKIKLCSIAALTDNTGILTNGKIGNFLGFSISVSNNVSEASAEVNSKCLFGTSQAITFAEQILSTEALRNATSFRDQLRGLHVWGCKVIMPDALGCAYLSALAES